MNPRARHGVSVKLAMATLSRHAMLTARADARKSAPTCGARTRAGLLCQAPPVWDHKAQRAVNGRCRLHGGMTPRKEGA